MIIQKIRDETPKSYIDSEENLSIPIFHLKSKNAKNSVTVKNRSQSYSLWWQKINIVLTRAV